MIWSVHPDPTDEAERQALLAAVEEALAEEGSAPSYDGPWWRAGFEDLGEFDETPAMSPGNEQRSVKPS